MSRIDIENLLDRYLKGEALPWETEQVETWLNEHTGHNTEWQHMNENDRNKWLSGLFSEIEASTGINDPKVVAMPSRKFAWRSIAAVAATLALFLTVYLEWPALQNRLHPTLLMVLNIPANEKKQVVLADGSVIQINSGSEIKYPQQFDATKREVYLSGEAYFDVHHDPSKPFIIHTGKVITTVLGTAFDIKEDSRLNTITVTVTRGKVSVADGNEVLGTITPNQQISFNKVSNLHVQKNVDASEFISWQQSDIHFNDITFADAAVQLEKRFKVKISFANEKIKNCRFTGTALKEDKLDNILKVICALNKSTYKAMSDGSIIINGQGCN